MGDKPILFVVDVEGYVSRGFHWLYLLVPVPYTDLYQIYTRHEDKPHHEWRPMGENACLWTKERATEIIMNKKCKRVDRLTALTLYGMVVEE